MGESAGDGRVRVVSSRQDVLTNLSKHSECGAICCFKSASCIADCFLVSIPI